MHDFYPIIILSKDFKSDNKNYLNINNSITLLNETTIEYNDIEISFDYLIFDNTSLIKNFLETNIIHENKIPITNFYHITSIENIFYTNDILNTINDIENEEI